MSIENNPYRLGVIRGLFPNWFNTGLIGDDWFRKRRDGGWAWIISERTFVVSCLTTEPNMINREAWVLTIIVFGRRFDIYHG